MDGQLSAAHRNIPLVALLDQAWLQDSLSDDDLYLPADAARDDKPAHDDDGAAVMTDSAGVTWALSVPNSAQAASGARAAGAKGARSAATLAALTQGSGSVGVGSAAAAVESADGLRWTDLALQGFAAQAHAQKQQ